ncbi:hypothetical protein BGZ75_003897 [Mortierella antarctica]|nr:hypothetical protein BGZ75_003897 [Mortierella antarctica]
MKFRSMHRCLRGLRGCDQYPPKVELTDTTGFVAYTATLQSVTTQKYADIDIHPHCVAGLLSEGQTASQYTRPFAEGLVGNKGLQQLAIHVVPASVTEQDDHDRQQPQVILAEPAVLAEFTVLFKLKNLEMLTLTGFTSIMEDAPIDISLPKLRSLVLDGVSFATERGCNSLRSLIKGSDLKTLMIANAPQTSDGLALVVNSCVRAKDLKHLQELDLSNNGLSREHITMVFKGVLSCCSKINKLSLQGNMGLDITAISRMPSRSDLTALDVSHVSFEFVERLVKAASVAGSLPALKSIIVRHMTSEQMGTESFNSFCAALREKSVLETLLIHSESSFWERTHHALEFNPSKMGPQELLWNDTAPWFESLGDGLGNNGSLIKFYLTGVSDLERYHADNPIAFRITELAPRLLELAPSTEELELMMAE